MAGPATSPGGSVLQAVRPELTGAGNHQSVTIGVASAQTAANLRAFKKKGSGSGVIRIASDTDCHVRIQNDPLSAGITALGTDPLLAAGGSEYWKFKDQDAIAVIQDVAGGTLYITVCK